MLTKLRNFRAIRKVDADRRRLHVEPLEVRAVLSAISVWNTLDSGPGSLRQAIVDANAQEGADVIKFAPSAYGEIELSAELGELLITDDLAINGPGQHKLAVSGGGVTRVFRVVPDVTVSFQKLTIADGRATDAPHTSLFTDFAAGGGILASEATLVLDRVSMTGNRVEGASVAVGGAIDLSPYGSLTVTHSSFSNNVATGGSVAVGGAIVCDLAALEVSHSSFSHNAAVGLEREVDPETWFAAFAGLGVATAIELVGNTGALRHSIFQHNVAVGGVGGDNGGQGGAGAGGGIASIAGTAPNVQYVTLLHNEARGGEGGSGGGTGGDGRGGGIGMALSPFPGFEFPVPSVMVSHSLIAGNAAVGGGGGDGGGAGGSGLGGGLGSISGSTAAVSRTTFLLNGARGGRGGVGGGDGGNGQGGAVYNAADSTTTMVRSIVFANLARGGRGDGDGVDGVGQGGGLFNDDDGLFKLDSLTRFWMRFNDASDDGDDLLGTFTLL